MATELLRFDCADAVASWQSIDDAVMGGRSRSALTFDAAGFARFEGEVSLERGGGFASVRAPLARPPGTPGGALQVELRGDGKRYKLSLRTDEAFDGISYQAVLEPPAGAWVVLARTPADFIPTFRGRAVAGAPTLDFTRVSQLGLVIGDRQAGEFRLDIRAICAA